MTPSKIPNAHEHKVVSSTPVVVRAIPNAHEHKESF